MKTLLVTGGAGYVGSHCCKALTQAGWRVVVFDNLSKGWRDLVRWGPLIEGDLLDRESLRRAFDEVRPEAVLHFAALSDIGESVRTPERFHRVNVTGSINLLQEMIRAGTRRFIFSSSCAVYGLPQFLPISEQHPQHPINPYGVSKQAVERVLGDLAGSDGLRYVALRYFNAAGADAEGETGERHRPETHVIPSAIQAALKGNGSSVTINGDDFDTRDGTAMRDFVHVADLAEGHVKALSYLMDGGASVALNLGGGTGTTVHEIIEAIERVAGVRLTRNVAPRREGDPDALIACADRAAAVLDWKVSRSDLETIIRTAWRWHAQGGR